MLKKLSTRFTILHKRRVNYSNPNLNSVSIERVPQFNSLGEVLVSTLKWDKHRTCIVKSFESNWCIIQIKAYLSTGDVTNSV